MALVCSNLMHDPFVSAYQSHMPVHQSCGKHHLQGVWGAARPPSGEREGRSRLAHTFMVRACIIAVGRSCCGRGGMYNDERAIVRTAENHPDSREPSA